MGREEVGVDGEEGGSNVEDGEEDLTGQGDAGCG